MLQIALTCEADGQTPIIWYKDGNVLTFSTRIEAFDELQRVVIKDSTFMDNGAYACAVGPVGLFSEIVHVKVNGIFFCS